MIVTKTSKEVELATAIQGSWEHKQDYEDVGRLRFWFVKPSYDVKVYQCGDVWIQRI